jgi:CDP-paratose 2-epimerase
MNKLVPFRSVLIFGGAGFIGSNWAHHLLRTTDANVHIYDNLSRRGVHQNLEWLKHLPESRDRLKITIGDVRDAGQVARAVNSATEIFHFAAQVAVTTSVDDPRTDFEINVGGTLNILEAARKTGRHPFILFTSTNKVYGKIPQSLSSTDTRYECREQPAVGESQPLDFYSPYGCSKGAADQYVHDYHRIYGLPTVVFRMSCIAGPHQFGTEDQGWVAHFLYSALQNNPIMIYGNGKQVRDVLCVHDLLRAFQLVRSRSAITAGQVYNLGGSPANAVSLLELIAEIEKLTGKRPALKYAEPRPGDQMYYVTDTSKIKNAVGWQPRLDVSQTLELIYEWWNENREVFPGVVREGLAGRRVSSSGLVPEAVS